MKILNLIDRPDCLEKICTWHHNEWGYLNPGRTLEARIEKMREHFAGKTIPATYVAEVDGQIVGSASILETDMPERPELTPWLASVFVDPTARKKNVGRTVVQKIMQHASDAGIRTLYLYTPDREHFYRHMGWQTLEKLVYHGADVTLMKIDFKA
ncbi:MAG TPA: GNAT family N-acetyltransferase [Candidatus Rifleibacterium sp.]|nr:GNAT family N-acetyltransferase [Candidatus Rifleibacterium sp.]HPT48210.1 GNAT family N-acetyltransferase [Candidatus Rifleibacterium sp.]